MKKTFLKNRIFYIVLSIGILFISRFTMCEDETLQQRLDREKKAIAREQEKQDLYEQKKAERKKAQDEQQAQSILREKEKQAALEQKALERDKAQALKEEQLRLKKEAQLTKDQIKRTEREKAEADREEQLSSQERKKQEKLERQKDRLERDRLEREQRLLKKEQDKEARLQEQDNKRAQALKLKKMQKAAMVQQALNSDDEQEHNKEQLRLKKEAQVIKDQIKKAKREKAEADREEQLSLQERKKQEKLEQQKDRLEKDRIEREQKLRKKEQDKEARLQEQDNKRAQALQRKKMQEAATVRQALNSDEEQEQKDAEQVFIEQEQIRMEQEAYARKIRKDAAREQAQADREIQLKKRQQEKQALLERKAARRNQMQMIKEAQLKLHQQDQLEKVRVRTAEREKIEIDRNEQLRLQQIKKAKKLKQRALEEEKARLDREQYLQQRDQEKQAQLEQKIAQREKAQTLKKEQQRIQKEFLEKQREEKHIEEDKPISDEHISHEPSNTKKKAYYGVLIEDFNTDDTNRVDDLGLQAQTPLEDIKPQVSQPVKVLQTNKTSLNQREWLKQHQRKRQNVLDQQANSHDKIDRNANNQSKQVMIGRDYYYSLIDVSTQRRWALPITCNFSLTNGAFDNNGQHTSLSNSIMGGPVTLEDIYLFARLGDENLVGNQSSFQPATKSPAVGQSGNLPFGAYANDLYTTLLAPMQIGFGLQQSEACIDFTAMYRFDIAACGKVIGFAGATLPVKTAIVDADLQLQQGMLYVESFAAGQNVVRERTLTQFFADYESVEDFFVRAVLGSKGIGFANRQVKVGMGDFSLFGIIDIGGLWEYADGIQFGLTIVFPTGSAGNPNMLFNPSLSDGSYKFEPFFNAIFNSPSPVFNPAVKLVGSFSASRSTGSSGGTRVGQTLSSSGRVQVKTVPGLSFPARFADYYVSAFDASSSSIPMFGDAAVPAIIKSGNKFLLGIGNYFFNVFNLGFRLGVFYDYIRKGSDSVCIDKCQGAFDTSGLTDNTSQRSHSIGFNLTYKFKNMLELNFGTENVIGGRNVPRTNDFFVSMIAVF